MDQGLAALWAGIAGLAGAGIGGGFAVWGAAIGGRRTVEAAQRVAVAEHQHWLRQQRHEAYQKLDLVVEETTHWHIPTAREVMDTSSRLRKAVSAVVVLGPAEVGDSAVRMLQPIVERLENLHAQGVGAGGGVPDTTPVPWDPVVLGELREAYSAYCLAVRSALNAPPT